MQSATVPVIMLNGTGTGGLDCHLCENFSHSDLPGPTTGFWELYETEIESPASSVCKALAHEERMSRPILEALGRMLPHILYHLYHSDLTLLQALRGESEMARSYAGGRVNVVVGYITAQHVDVIVNAANPQLGNGVGVTAAIFSAAGSGFAEECADVWRSLSNLIGYAGSSPRPRKFLWRAFY